MHRIGYVLPEGFQVMTFATQSVFEMANLQAGRPLYQVQSYALGGGSVRASAGIEVQALPLTARSSADTWMVAGRVSPLAAPAEPELLRLLDRLAARATRTCALCTGAFVLADAGLLDGRRATTHWAWARDFAERYPQVQLDPDVLYLEDGELLTSAGTAAGIDCCLHLLRQHCGAETANRVARRLVVPPHRQGGQAQFIEQPLPTSPRDDRLTCVLDWVRSNLEQEHSLDSLAQRVLMSRRTFSRHFRQLTGSTLGEWLLAERLALTQRLLEGTDQSVEKIATLAGFGSPVSLRHHFGRAFGVSPSAWRQSFQGSVA